MAAPHYVEVLSGGPRPVFGEPPARLRSGSWKIYYIPNDDSALVAIRTLLHMKLPGGSGEWCLLMTESGGAAVVQVWNDGVLMVTGNPLTFSARQRLKITVDGAAGSLQVEGATAGDGTNTDTPWSVGEGGGEWRVGTGAAGADPALGYVSLPYGLQTDDPLPYGTGADADYLLTEDSDRVLEEGGGGVLIE